MIHEQRELLEVTAKGGRALPRFLSFLSFNTLFQADSPRFEPNSGMKTVSISTRRLRLFYIFAKSVFIRFSHRDLNFCKEFTRCLLFWLLAWKLLARAMSWSCS